MSDPHNSYTNHPGVDATDCEIRHVVSNELFSMNGYACLYTGGHCIPDEHCKKRQESHEKSRLFNEQLIVVNDKDII